MNKYVFFQFFYKLKGSLLNRDFFQKCSLLSEVQFSDHPLIQKILDEENFELSELWKQSITEREFLIKHYSWLQKQKIGVVIRGDSDYPLCFEHCEDPPWLLYYRGSLEIFGSPSLAVVGSREVSEHSKVWMQQEFYDFLRANPVATISGGARGIDSEAHLISLRLGLPTAVVLPSGLGQTYPSSVKDLEEEVIAKRGVILSEFPHNSKMHKSFFHHRNRLIAAAGRATLIVQAQIRSGTMITAHQSARNGRPVWCVPGHPKDPLFSGCLRLINEGATLVSDAHELSALWRSEINSIS